jgi:hypothetical protein
LTDRQQWILDALGAGELLQMMEILDRLGGRYPRRTIQLDLSTLQRLGLVETVGKARSTRWRRTR